MNGEHYHEYETVRADCVQGKEGFDISCVRVCFRCGTAKREIYPIKEVPLG